MRRKWYANIFLQNRTLVEHGVSKIQKLVGWSCRNEGNINSKHKSSKITQMSESNHAATYVHGLMALNLG